MEPRLGLRSLQQRRVSLWARGLGVAPLKKQCACTRLGASKDVQGSSAHWDRGDQQSIWSEAKWLPWGRSQHRDKGQRGRHDGTCLLPTTALQFLRGVPHTPPGTPAKAELAASLLGAPRAPRIQSIWPTFRQPRAAISLALVEMGLDSPKGLRPHPEAHCWGRSCM